MRKDVQSINMQSFTKRIQTTDMKSDEWWYRKAEAEYWCGSCGSCGSYGARVVLQIRKVVVELVTHAHKLLVGAVELCHVRLSNACQVRLNLDR